MKITSPLYSFKDTGLVVNYDTNSQRDEALNLIGSSWIDIKIGIAKYAISRHSVIVTDTDLFCHDDYIGNLVGSTVILVAKVSRLSASPKRLRKAEEKLKAAGIKVIYRASLKTALSTLEKMKPSNPFMGWMQSTSPVSKLSSSPVRLVSVK